MPSPSSPADAADAPTGRHVIWLTFPAFSHIKATFGMVEELTRRGHRVTYLVADRLADRAEHTGARVVPYRSTFPISVGHDETATTMTVEFLTESFAPLELALEAAAADPPDLVVYDVLASDVAMAVSRRHAVPSACTYAGLGSNDQVPLNGTEEPTGPIDPDDPRLRDLAAELTSRVEAAGVAELLADGPAGGDGAAVNISFVTREFQIRGETFGDEYVFAGPCLREADFAGQWSPPPGSPPVLLVTLGTTANANPEFFRMCARTFAPTGWHVVMTLGGRVDPAELGPMPPNVEVHPWIPHLAVLEHASAFVCQGGTGSLMEAFHQGVPVVVVPQFPDQQAIARQVADLRLGHCVQPADLTAESLLATVEAVAADDGIRAAASAMSRAVREAPGPSGVADRLEAIMEHSTERARAV